MIKNGWNRQDSNPCWCPFWPKCTHFTNRKFTNHEIIDFPRISANFHMYHMKVHKKWSLKQPLDSFCCLLLSYKKQQIMSIIWSFLINLPWPCWLRRRRKYLLPLMLWVQTPPKQKSFLSFFLPSKAARPFLYWAINNALGGILTWFRFSE